MNEFRDSQRCQLISEGKEPLLLPGEEGASPMTVNTSSRWPESRAVVADLTTSHPRAENVPHRNFQLLSPRRDDRVLRLVRARCQCHPSRNPCRIERCRKIERVRAI